MITLVIPYMVVSIVLGFIGGLVLGKGIRTKATGLIITGTILSVLGISSVFWLPALFGGR